MWRVATKQSGDTIVEVLIVLAVLGSALGISYSTANRSLAGARQAQEHTEALQLLQSQLEGLRYLQPYQSDSHKNIFRDRLFCINDATATHPLAIWASNDLDIHHLDQYRPQCVINSRYYISVQYDSSQQDLFTATALWDDVTGNGTDSVSLVYRLHP